MVNLPTITTEEIQRRYDALPDRVLEAFEGEQTSAVMLRIGKEYGIPIDKIGQISELVGYALLGFVSPMEFAVDVVGVVGDADKAKRIVDTIDREIFSPIHNLLKMETGGAPQQERAPTLPPRPIMLERKPAIPPLPRVPPPPPPARPSIPTPQQWRLPKLRNGRSSPISPLQLPSDGVEITPPRKITPPPVPAKPAPPPPPPLIPQKPAAQFRQAPSFSSQEISIDRSIPREKLFELQHSTPVVTPAPATPEKLPEPARPEAKPKPPEEKQLPLKPISRIVPPSHRVVPLVIKPLPSPPEEPQIVTEPLREKPDSHKTTTLPPKKQSAVEEKRTTPAPTRSSHQPIPSYQAIHDAVAKELEVFEKKRETLALPPSPPSKPPTPPLPSAVGEHTLMQIPSAKQEPALSEHTTTPRAPSPEIPKAPVVAPHNPARTTDPYREVPE